MTPYSKDMVDFAQFTISTVIAPWKTISPTANIHVFLNEVFHHIQCGYNSHINIVHLVQVVN